MTTIGEPTSTSTAVGSSPSSPRGDSGNDVSTRSCFQRRSSSPSSAQSAAVVDSRTVRDPVGQPGEEDSCDKTDESIRIEDSDPDLRSENRERRSQTGHVENPAQGVGEQRGSAGRRREPGSESEAIPGAAEELPERQGEVAATVDRQTGDATEAGETTAREDDDDWEDVEELDSEEQVDEEADEGSIGCAHYNRKCKVVAPCCGEVFFCRHCHNEVKSEGEKDYKKAHEMDRTAVKEIICAVCDKRQEVSNKCIGCGTVFGKYYCSKCKFWDDKGLQKKVYHCDQCGLCRKGGAENFFHCNTCGSCYSVSIRDSHKCVENVMRQACPICCENMFTSIRQVHVLKCGHTLHADCLRQLNSECVGLQALRCPLCCKSLGDYGRIWERLDDEVARTPLPDELKRKALAKCNDCDARTEVDFHIVGLKCGACGGYNTREINA